MNIVEQSIILADNELLEKRIKFGVKSGVKNGVNSGVTLFFNGNYWRSEL